ncbi:hypothetical protein EDB19DRAFT_1828711 [Suillus lakei]|nr:hypothetical protein EDB19DRAFT_1828711 [Suillus lakei]
MQKTTGQIYNLSERGCRAVQSTMVMSVRCTHPKVWHADRYSLSGRVQSSVIDDGDVHEMYPPEGNWNDDLNSPPSTLIRHTSVTLVPSASKEQIWHSQSDDFIGSSAHRRVAGGIRPRQSRVMIYYDTLAFTQPRYKKIGKRTVKCRNFSITNVLLDIPQILTLLNLWLIIKLDLRSLDTMQFHPHHH